MMTRRAFLRCAAAAGLADTLGAPAESDSELPVIDSHAHFWNPARLDYPWLNGSPIGGAKLPVDYFRETAGCGVEKVVFVQADCRPEQARQEVDWVASLAREEPRIAAVVAFAPVEKPAEIGPALEKLARCPLVKGVRRLVQGEPALDFCARPEFVAGVKLVGAKGWNFEIGAREEQLSAAAKLVEQCPAVNFVLDHLGVPDIARGSLHPWSEHLRRLASFPNVTCKVSGAITRADWKNWRAEQLRPFIDVAFEAFGFERVMFGGDWPVCLLAGGWRRWLDALREITRGRTDGEKRRLFSENARRCYGLK
ncbi:MAG TPA: amidohydrolase family protein [Verrucomicrobiae bacterium]|jgi:L-fuconolactonase